MNYNETLAYIHSVSNFFCKPGLSRISELCEKIGNPQNELKFVHVAGTNGKGSFCKMLSSVLTAAGYRTGLYTSPYILEFNERIAVDSVMIDNDSLCEITQIIKKAADGMEDKPTEFELITAVAFEYFKRQKCDIVVLECGLGGRFDATNIIKDSILSVITGISIDHTSFLGDTVEKIAYEKAGIIKNGGTCLWCGKDDNAYDVINTFSKQQNARLIVPKTESLKVKKWNIEGTVFDYAEYKDVAISLLGSFQPQNAVNVLNAVDVLKNSGYNIPDSAVYSGLYAAKWKARFEIISRKPLIIADGGHNPEGVAAAVESVKLYFNNTKVHVITGVMKDKDYNYIAGRISEIAEDVYCITPDNPRALSATEYAKVYNGLGVPAQEMSSVGDAVKKAISVSMNDNKPIIALGSLYMYKEIFDAVNSKISK